MQIFNHKIKLSVIITLSVMTLIGSLSIKPASAYSYAAAGKEPLIEASEAFYKAFNDDAYEDLQKIYLPFRKEIEYLDINHDEGLLLSFDDAVAEKDDKLIINALNRAVIADISRRLNAALINIENYQMAKILIIKSKQLYDIMAQSYGAGKRQTIYNNLDICLNAIGNPGIFGVGKKPADATVYKSALDKILSILAK